MISLKRLESMRRWAMWGGDDLHGMRPSDATWGVRAGLLRVKTRASGPALVATERLGPVIAKAEAEHERHRTEHMRDVHRMRAVEKKRAAVAFQKWKHDRALDLLMPRWWNGRSIHEWHAYRRLAELLAAKLDSVTVSGDD